MQILQGNKGGVAIRIRYKDSYLCFVDSHLAHDISQLERRNQDYQEICRKLTFPSANPYDITKSPAGNAALGIASRMVSLFESEYVRIQLYCIAGTRSISCKR